ncbi:MFS transporter [Vibrio hannami]|uniref:MFS transporter n=1 Tax=Vibrio hannami TaxID=2717094 RepID=UPI00240F5021|nr:MFS transporter [Vibrio hannami]MDG3086427.1 MFS transporter [Vibrio hannami]
MLRFLLCSFALVLLYPTAIDLYLVGLPQIASDLNATESQLHIAFSVYLAGMTATMLFVGRLADSIGRKPFAVGGAVIFIIASFLGGAADHVPLFLAARFAQGVGAGSCYVVAFAILRDVLDDKRRAKVLSAINGVTCIVPVLAPVVGHLIMLKFPWTSLFTTMATMGVVVCLLSLFVLKETRPNVQQHEDAVSGAALSANESLLDSFFVSRLIITSLGATIILAYVNVSPMLIMGKLGFDRAAYSTTMAATALVSMVVSFSAPFALSVFKERTLMMTAQFLFGFAAILLVLANELALETIWYLISFGLVCAGFSIGFGVAMSQALGAFSRRAGAASSALGVCQVCCSALYIWLMGMVGFDALTILALILALGSIISVSLILLIPRPSPGIQNEEVNYSS